MPPTDPEKAPPEPLPRRAFCGAVAAGAAAFVVALDLLDDALPLTVPIIGQKLEYFQRHKDDYTLVALGTSYTFRHFVPSAFDAVLTKAGHASRSFNFGVSRMLLAEASLLADEIVDLKPKKLRQVAIELGLFHDLGDDEDDDALSEREIGWHTPAETLAAVTQVMEGKSDIDDKLDSLGSHVHAMLCNVTPAGRSARHFQEYWDDELDDTTAERYERVENDGYQSLDEIANLPWINARHQRFLAGAAAFTKSVEKRRARPRVQRIGRRARTVLKRTAERLLAADLRPIFYESPSMYPQKRLNASLRKLVPVFSYNDPRRHSNLYRVEHRFDRGHLNHPGALLLSETFGRDFAAHLGGRRAT
ncbi:MAG TPA: hypothetical protein VF989_05340 [Polyangiaceae bacterium]|jgi:hypothetical protein